MLTQRLRELLNARHQDLQYEINLYQAVAASSKAGAGLFAESLREGLYDKLDIDLDDLIEEAEEEAKEDGEKLSTKELENIKSKAPAEAFQEAHTELNLFMTMDRKISEFQDAGASEEEVQGLRSFQKRLENVIYKRYDITDKDLKEDGDGE